MPSREGAVEFLVFVLLFVLLDLIALRWGTDTREKINSCEWKNRMQWGEFI